MTSRPIFVRTAVTLALACSSLGCASEKDALEKRVASMQEELIAVQNANDRLAERLMTLEIQQARGGGGKSERRAAAAESDGEPADDPVERPPLKVVRLAPSAQAPASPAVSEAEAHENPEDEGARPVIRDLGSGRSASRPGARPVGMTKVKERAAPAAGER